MNWGLGIDGWVWNKKLGGRNQHMTMLDLQEAELKAKSLILPTQNGRKVGNRYAQISTE